MIAVANSRLRIKRQAPQLGHLQLYLPGLRVQPPFAAPGPRVPTLRAPLIALPRPSCTHPPLAWDDAFFLSLRRRRGQNSAMREFPHIPPASTFRERVSSSPVTRFASAEGRNGGKLGDTAECSLN